MSGYDLYGGKPPHQKVDTSVEAAEAIQPEVNRLHQLVIERISSVGSSTDDELEDALGLPHQTVSARRRELVLKGVLFDSGERRPTKHGKKAIVWTLQAPESALAPEPVARPHSYLRCLPPLPEPEEVKRYKAYLTRLSKWVATELADEKTEYQVGTNVLRGNLIGRGELAFYLDAGWAKRIFSDKGLFTDVGAGFWKVAQLPPEDSPSEPSEWSGPRPGEDITGSAIQRTIDTLSRFDPPNWKSRWLEGDEWMRIHPVVVSALTYAQSRGIEKPLVPLQERAFLESMADEEEALQTIGIWLTNTRAVLEAHGRFQTAIKDRSMAGLYPGDLLLFRDNVIRAVETPHKVSDSFAFTRRLLLERGILHGKKS